MMGQILTAANLSEAFVKAREKLNYTGRLEFNIISKQSPLYKNDKVIIKFNLPYQYDKTVYVQIK